MIILVIFLVLSILISIYLGYRAYYLAGTLADAQEYIDELELTNEFMYGRIVDAYNNLKEIDHKGAFEAEDETGTTFQLLLQTVTELKDTFNGEESEEK
jgi:hypothetical protein